jgi:putative acetyltransferase
MPNVRHEAPPDVAAIRRVNLAAFPTAAEADLVDSLRGRVQPWISLVAADPEVIGHILFTPVTVGPSSALALGPMSVLPSRQHQGIGAALVREGLEACRCAGHTMVFVLGHPAYYPHFGFARADRHEISCRYECPPDAFMVVELTPGALKDVHGVVCYHHAFDEV